MRPANPLRAPGLAGHALLAGTVAGLLSDAVLAWRGRAELARPLAPLNAPAHWFLGPQSLREDRASWRHTATGLAVHQASSYFWAIFYAALQARRRPGDRLGTLVDATAVTAVAACVDLRLVPERLTPGFERRLSTPGVAAVYVAFALGLAAASWARR